MALTKATLIDLNSNELVLDLDADTSITADTDDTIHFKIAGADELVMTGTALTPAVADGSALGSTSLEWSDIFLADGAVINFGADQDINITHVADTGLTTNADFTVGDDLFVSGGLIDLKNTGTVSTIKFYCESSNAHAQSLVSAPHSEAASNTLTLPGTGGDARLVSTSSTATLTNKTLTTPVIAEIDSGSTITLDATTDIVLDADGGDIFFKDAGTTFGSATNTSGNLIIKSGTTTAATFSGANVTLAGTVGSGAITSTGIVTGTGFTAGSAVLAEAELELLDGLTAGTAIASKVVTTDANIDTTGQRNLTISGELDAASLDISGNADIDGTLETDALSIASTTVTATAAELNILDGVTSTASEINLLDGGTSVGSSITLADTDGFVVNDGGTMKTIPASDVKAYSPGGLLNRIINGDMRIDQRYSGTAVTTASGYTLDRWKFQEGGSGNQALSVQRVTDSPAGFAYSAKQTVTTDTSSIAADAYNMFWQAIEGFNWADAGWGASGAKSVTLSFHVKSSIAGNYSLAIRSSNNDRSYVVPYAISSADTWEKITLVIPGPTDGTFTADNTKTIQVAFTHSMGSNYTSSGNGAWQSESKLGATGTQVALTNTDGATWQVTGVQLEVNSTATSFEYRQLGQELELCQRYYYRRNLGLFGLGFINNTTTMGVSITYPVSMRIAPTALEQTGTASNYQIVYLATAAACSAVPAFGGETSTDATRVTATVSSGLTAGQAGGLRAATTGVYLAWSAEL